MYKRTIADRKTSRTHAEPFSICNITVCQSASTVPAPTYVWTVSEGGKRSTNTGRKSQPHVVLMEDLGSILTEIVSSSSSIDNVVT